MLKERTCEYRGRIYSAREDGSIYRHAKQGCKPSKLDEVWTYGNKDERTGYMLYGGVRVHQVVATAFHGAPCDEHMVIDHRDTNRCNNRPENLFWVTRLENVLNNPYTRRRIELLCGSIEAFLQDPSILRETAGEPNTKWMRTVSKEESAKCLRNLDRWLKEDKLHTGRPSGHGIGDWIFGDHISIESPYELKDSLTKGAKQLNWKTPCEFPLVPEHLSERPLEDYFNKLAGGLIFSRNQYSETPIIKAEISEDGSCIAVISELRNNATHYALTKIIYEDGSYIHENIRSFFTEDGVEKYYTELLGREWTGGDVLEDYC